MPKTSSQNDGRRLRVGSLFSGYGGLDLAVEQVFDARTVWFSEINEPVARVFAHHWPDAPNLGDITSVDWNDVPPVDVLIGGFPCLNVKLGGVSVRLGVQRCGLLRCHSLGCGGSLLPIA